MTIEDGDRDSIPPTMQEEVCGEFGVYDETELRSALERARVVGVLDAWADRDGGKAPAPERRHDGRWYIFWLSTGFGDVLNEHEVSGDSPDAARAAAAKAIEAGEV